MSDIDEISRYMTFARPLYVGKDVGHGFGHIEGIISRLDELTEGLTPPPSGPKLNFLACFHGLGDRIGSDQDLREKVTEFLLALGWARDDIEASFASLARHLSDPQTSEEMMVHDANYFEVTGALGVAKAFTVGGARGQTYRQTLTIFAANLDRVRFRTPTGKRLYEARKAYARAYLEELRQDLSSSAERSGRT